jgi:hypothetical protein
MKEIKYLSPTSISIYKQDKELFYSQYLSEMPFARDPQTLAMAVGSSFDAYVKSYLHSSLYGSQHKDSNKFNFDTIFQSQVEKQCRDKAIVHGKYCFEQYKSSGALGDLMLELQNSTGDCRFEFEVRGVVNNYREGSEVEIDEVTLLGRPDVSYISREGALVILDFKVNNFYGERNISPVPHYIRLRGAGKTSYGAHKDAFVIDHKGIKINCATTLDVVKQDWSSQLAIYAWILGGGVGGEFIIAIDQIVCSPNKGGLPTIKVAEHRSLINSEWQKKLFREIVEIWTVVKSDHYFRDMSLEDSIERCKLLDGRAFGTVETPEDEWLQKVTKKPRY